MQLNMIQTMPHLLDDAKIQKIQHFFNDFDQKTMTELLFTLYPKMRVVFSFFKEYFPKACQGRKVFHLFQNFPHNAPLYNQNVNFKQLFPILRSNLEPIEES